MYNSNSPQQLRGVENQNQSPYSGNPETSFMAYSVGTKSVGGMALTLASKISLALSRIASTGGKQTLNADDEEDLADLLQLIEELNSHTDLTVKLSN